MKRINHILIAAMVLVLVAMFANADIPPAPVELGNNVGDYWVNYTWSKDIECPDNDNATDSFNVSMNGVWNNGTATFLNESVGPDGRANITVWAYNRAGNGNMSVGNVSDNVQALSVPPLLCTCGDICVNPSGWWRGGGDFNGNATPIQAAVDNATAGETICVAFGNYSENVDIGTPHLTLQSAGAVIVTAPDPGNDHIFNVTADWVNISGFTLTGSTDAAGITLYGVEHCDISDNNASNNDYGIYLEYSSNNALADNIASGNDCDGIVLMESSNDNTLTGNNASNNDCGIYIESSSNNALADNIASGNDCDGIGLYNSSNDNKLTDNIASDNEDGIGLYDSSNNTLTGNNASNNEGGIGLYDSSNDNTLTDNIALGNDCDGIGLYDSSNDNTLTDNIALGNDCDGIGLYNSSNDNKLTDNIADSNNEDGIGLYDSSNNTLTGNNASNNEGGIGLYDSSNDNTLTGNNASNNVYGIMLEDSSNNTLTGNNASNNVYGIMLEDSSNNTLTGNTANSNGGAPNLPANGGLPGSGIYLSSSSNNTLTGNNASGNMVGIGLVVIDLVMVGSDPDCSSDYNTLTGNNASGNMVGIGLGGSSNNMLTGNIASGNMVGIVLEDSSNNTLTGNTANSNGGGYDLTVQQEVVLSGIYLNSSSNNTLSSNTAADNSDWDIYIEDSPSNTFADNTLSGTMVSFTYSGSVSLRGVGLPAAGAPWYSIGKFISATNQSEGAWMILNFSYSNSDFTGAMNESNLTVRKHNGTVWVKDGWNGTRYSDPANNTVGVNITSFSVFAPMTTGVPDLDHITVEPESALLYIDKPPKLQTFAATGRSKHTDPIPDLMFGWSNTDTSVGGLNNSTGTVVNFTAGRVGRAYLTARSGSVTSDQAQVTVDSGTNNTHVTNGTATATSGDVTVTCNLGEGVTGWINITAIGNATNASEVNPSKPRYGLGSGDKAVSGVTVDVSEDILEKLAAGSTIRIKICYNATTLAALGIDASTLAIWKYNCTTEKWMRQSSTRSGTCVYVDVNHLCPYGLFGSKATGGGGTTTTTSSSSGGSGGIYPPGWFETPTPAVTATKAPTASTTGAATDASPGDKATPRPTKQTTSPKTTTPTAEDTAAGKPANGATGFTAVFVIAGMLAIAYAMMRRRE